MYPHEFNLEPDLIYLNHAAVAPWPVRTAEAVRQFADENSRLGAADYPRWMTVEQQLREQMAWLVGAGSSEDISIQKSTSEGLSAIAHGLEWQPGQNVACFRQEFPSNRVVWQSLERYGVETRLVDLESDPEDPEAALFRSCDEKTRMISVSSVQYGTGIRMDLARIGQFCRDRGILFCVDAIQSLGAFEFDLKAIGAHFVVADGHKWMLGPEGVALLYTDPDLRPGMKLHQYGWHMLEHPSYFEQIESEPATSGKRFECGSPNLLGSHALNSSLSLIREIGLATISKRILENSALMIERIERDNRLELISPRGESRRSGIVTFRVKGLESESLYRELMKRRVICAPRGGGIRFSPHFYTEAEKLNRGFDILNRIIDDQRRP